MSDYSPTPYRALKACIWLYFWLLLLEGALRKWILPGFSDILFVVRDPVVIFIYFLAWRDGVFPRRPAMVALWVMAVASAGFSLAGDSSPLVTAFGLRTNYLHLPFVFVMEAVLRREDVVAFGKAVLCSAVPIVLLMLVQFNSSRFSWINVGVGDGAQILGALDRIRPPGPFSFIAGVVSFFALAGAFSLAGWVRTGDFPRRLLIVATLAVIVAVPVSISRSLLLALLIVGAFSLSLAVFDLRRLPKYLAPLAAGVLLVVVFSETTYVQALSRRWNDSLIAGEGDFYSNVVERMLGDFTQPLHAAMTAPFFGHGIGMGTVAGARLTTGTSAFLLAESELARLVQELGPLLGTAFICWRWWLAALLLVRGWRTSRLRGDPLGWLLAGACAGSVMMGQWGPATQLGFSVFVAGLSLAASKEPEDDPPPSETRDEAATVSA